MTAVTTVTAVDLRHQIERLVNEGLADRLTTVGAYAAGDIIDEITCFYADKKWHRGRPLDVASVMAMFDFARFVQCPRPGGYRRQH